MDILGLDGDLNGTARAAAVVDLGALNLSCRFGPGVGRRYTLLLKAGPIKAKTLKSVLVGTFRHDPAHNLSSKAGRSSPWMQLACHVDKLSAGGVASAERHLGVSAGLSYIEAIQLLVTLSAPCQDWRAAVRTELARRVSQDWFLLLAHRRRALPHLAISHVGPLPAFY